MCVTENVRSAEPFTIIGIPDTQRLVLSDRPEFSASTSWIKNNTNSLNLQMILHEGDLIDHQNTSAEWVRANTSMSILFDDNLPLVMIPGNHDVCGVHDGMWQHNFPVTRFRDLYNATNTSSYWGDNFPGNSSSNYYTFFNASGYKFIVIGYGFCPADATVEWVNDTLNNHTDKHAIILTHAHTHVNDTLITWDGTYNCNGAECEQGNNSGQTVWDKMMQYHDNIIMVISGHCIGEGGDEHEPGHLGYVNKSHPTTLRSGNFCPNSHHLLYNYQAEPGNTEGGNGTINIYRFDPDNKTINITTYIPYNDVYYWANGNNRELFYDFDFSAPPTVNKKLISMPDYNGAIWDIYLNQDDAHVKLECNETNDFGVPKYIFWDNESSDGGEHGYRYHFQETDLSNGFTTNCTVYYRFTCLNGTDNSSVNNTGHVDLWSPYVTAISPADTTEIDAVDTYINATINITNGGNFTYITYNRSYFAVGEALATGYGINQSVNYHWQNLDYSTMYTWCIQIQTNDTEDNGNISTRTNAWGTANEITFWTLNNTAPSISNPSPNDGDTGVSIGLIGVDITIEDIDSNDLNWSVETSWGDSRINGNVTDTITKGIVGGDDVLSYESIGLIKKVWQGGTIYDVAVDYILSGNTIDWSPGGAEPAPGSTYYVNYWYNGTPENCTIYCNKTGDWEDFSYSTSYTWWVNVTDGYQWTNETYGFTTGSAPSSPTPPGGGGYVPPPEVPEEGEDIIIDDEQKTPGFSITIVFIAFISMMLLGRRKKGKNN